MLWERWRAGGRRSGALGGTGGNFDYSAQGGPERGGEVGAKTRR